ncbi:mersacidin/lichenicidin family type 2 lantibiotic [Kyrpidia tusciae]|uniref:Uncharacterized protein n=1 Tax=Kyrpidia tusciae (strain DSM 2912 / NBRC 15312 / T2) TaxID=562970 RepID=D5WV12_KYRT2|nr:mersacidin/lichenicidin family type 2 lantibiotic [Kyrpidia tusciae]ADG07484.1 hypothetical protein Btus_2845 [Kyrpidia tusciae DSM 2912]
MMNPDVVIQAWKDPGFRCGLAGTPAHPAGEAMERLDETELGAIYGGDVNADTTPATPWIVASSEACGFVIATGVIWALSQFKAC